jgi:hypothetical protein
MKGTGRKDLIALLKTRSTGYFELTTSFAHRMMAKGKENPTAQSILSSKIHSLDSCSGSKLILTILSLLSLEFFAGGKYSSPLVAHNNKTRDCQIRTEWNKKSCRLQVSGSGFKAISHAKPPRTQR